MTQQENISSGKLRVGEIVLICIFFAFAIGFSIPPIINQIHKVRHGENGTKDYPLWYETGDRELHNISPYYIDRNGEFPFMYPPGAAGLLAPLTIAGKMPLLILMVLLNTIAWATCVLAPVYLVAGRIRGLPMVLYWLPSLFCCVFIWDTYLEGQLAFCLSACLLAMLVCLQRSKQWSAGFWLALAAGFKAFPILALPYLIYRKKWWAVVSTFVFLFVFLLVIPSIFRGPSGAWEDLKTWKTGMMASSTPEKIGGPHARAARSYTWQNGSLLGVAHRWLRPVIADHDDNVPPMTVNIAELKFETINHIVTGIQLCLCLGYVAVIPSRRGRTRFTDAADAAMLLILIILFCPLSFNYNNAWLMFGIAVILYWITLCATSDRQKIIATSWLLLAMFLLIFSASTTNHTWRWIRAMGNTCFADLMILLELGGVIVLERSRKGVSPVHENTSETPV